MHRPQEGQCRRGQGNSQNKKEVQAFNGFLNFCYCFIEDFSKIVKHLHNLTSNQPFLWGADQQTTFDALKDKLCSSLVLCIPINDSPFHVEINCSQFVIGSILSQYIDGKWHLVMYQSQALMAAEWDYKIHC